MVEIPHGEINLEWFDNVLICAPLGPINGPGAQMFSEKICTSIIGKAPTKPWIRVEFFRDFYTLATPDAYRFLLETLTCSVKYQCEMICVVGVNSCNLRLFEHYSQIVGLPFLAFSRLSVLTDFLKEKGFAKNADLLKDRLESI